jgi:putative Mn2+ efflux pump MntP
MSFMGNLMPNTAGMDMVSVFFIACGLAMDAFAVSVASGLAEKKLQFRYAFKIAVFFGLFQAVMPVVGWLMGFGLRAYITEIDHWVAFGLLALVGGKMIYESFKFKEAENPSSPHGIYVLLLLSIATSIDALAIGISLTLINVPIIMPAIVIGIVTFIFSCSGVYIGNRFGHFFEKKIEALGGVILIGIGLKILIEHLGG